MRKNNVSQQAGITQDELLTILKQSGRPNFTKRRLTHLTSEGFLPQPRRTSHAGSNAPVYVWKPEVIEQATILYDLIEQRMVRHQLFLALWLIGYDVPFEPILRHWTQPLDVLLHNLTGGAQDPDEALWHISESLVQFIEPKWKFSPRPDEVIREVGVDAWRDFMEFMLSLLAVPDYEPDETSYEGVRRTLLKMNKIAQVNVDPDETLSEVASLRKVFTLPRYRDALLNATVEEWMHVREDYLTFCQLLHQLASLFPQRNARLTEEMRQALFLKGGSMLLPLLLAVRYAGYGDRIDEALAYLSEMLNDILTDPNVCRLFSTM
ncbi:MAG TPA: hypothetical protein DHW02_21375 [Ktedonobacter sp.]|nr:hypothetical protein [Ktedonobacter sp.]